MEICEEVPVNSSSILTSQPFWRLQEYPGQTEILNYSYNGGVFLPHNGFGFERNSGKSSLFHTINLRRTAVFSIVGCFPAEQTTSIALTESNHLSSEIRNPSGGGSRPLRARILSFSPFYPISG
jgi:hypothetical protein